MASQTAHQTARNVAGRVPHVLFPSRAALAVELAIEVAALRAGLPLAGHLAVAVGAHIAIGLADSCRR